MIIIFVNDCKFCKIIRGEISSAKVYEDDKVVAFLDNQPFSEGHTLVIPKKHYNNFLEFENKEMKDFFITLKKIMIKLKSRLNPDGMHILQNNFQAAGQIINHLHFHIVLRWEGDNIPAFGKPQNSATLEELQEVLKKFNK